MQIEAAHLLVNGLLNDARDTYTALSREADARLSLVMDTVPTDNRRKDLAYLEAAPHFEFWRRGESIPKDSMKSVKFEAIAHNFARRVAWHKDDRADDQLQTIMESARMVGASAALNPERIFFDLLLGTTNFLPAVPNAPDGADFFNATDGASNDRFGFSGGNVVTGTGVTAVSDIKSGYYAAIEAFKGFQDGKGQPLFRDDICDGGVVIIFGSANTEIFEEAFIQRRQGMGIDTTGAISTATGVTAGTTPSNVILDASRDVTLWGTQRITTNSWYVFLKRSPKKAAFLFEREPLKEFSSLEGDNNGDLTRDTGEEYVQWETRQGGGIHLPYGAVQVSN